MESHGFLLYTALKKYTDLFFHNGNVFVCVIVLVIVSINPCTTQDYFWLDLIIRTLISYYSHKSSYFGQHSVKK